MGLVSGFTLSALVIALAWIIYKPLYGVPLLILVLLSLYMIFLYPSYPIPEDSDETQAPGNSEPDETPENGADTNTSN